MKASAMSSSRSLFFHTTDLWQKRGGKEPPRWTERPLASMRRCERAGRRREGGKMLDQAVTQSPDPETSRRQAAARYVFAFAIVALALWTFAKYLPALGWAGVIAIATWPLYLRWRERSRGALRAALPALFAIAIGLVFLAPVVGAGWFVGREARAAAHWLEEARKHGVAPPEGLEKLKFVGPSAVAWWRENLAEPESAEGLIKGFEKAPLIAMSEHLGAAAGRRL